ncbi:MAG: hypothetical protein J4431_01245 [Candidatus Aenigmarchaeota archaeon]|nr:hypothetical protein [Candidatus Aenigmarchaeota archaeon]
MNFSNYWKGALAIAAALAITGGVAGAVNAPRDNARVILRYPIENCERRTLVLPSDKAWNRHYRTLNSMVERAYPGTGIAGYGWDNLQGASRITRVDIKVAASDAADITINMRGNSNASSSVYSYGDEADERHRQEIVITEPGGIGMSLDYDREHNPMPVDFQRLGEDVTDLFCVDVVTSPKRADPIFKPPSHANPGKLYER